MLDLWMTDKCVIGNTKRVGIIWRKCHLKREILVEKANIMTWKLQYLKEVQAYWYNRHLMLYTHKTLTDSSLTFHKCWQEFEVMGIHTHVNSGNRLIILHIGELVDFFLHANFIYKAGFEAGYYHWQTNATNLREVGSQETYY